MFHYLCVRHNLDIYYMRKTLLLLFFVLTLGVTKTHAQYEGTIGFGAHTGYANEFKSLGAGFHIHYYHKNKLRYVPSLTFYYPRKSTHIWDVDFDAHFLMPLNWEFTFYPLLGVHYSNLKYKPLVNSGDGYVDDWRKNRLGLNLGVGFQYDLAYRLRSSLELKYQVIKDYSQVNLMLGFGFWF